MAGVKRRSLGRTGLAVPELGLGAMDTPHSPEALETVAAAVDLGIEFIDTARDYEGSEQLLGRFVRERGEEGILFASKTFGRTANKAQYDIDRSLAVLGVERIALYQLHDVSSIATWQSVMGGGGALAGLRAAQDRGLIGHIGASCHDLEVARLVIESGEFDTIMVEYSAFFPASAPLIDLAAQRDVGVIVMRPVGGSGRTSVMRGRMADGSSGALTPANLLRYVWSNPGVSVAIPGARYPSRVRENVETALNYQPMTEREKREIEAAAKELY